MEKHPVSAEFEATIDSEGLIRVPEEILGMLNEKKTRKVHVRLRAGFITRKLRDRGITEEEIERISSTQLETPDQVVKFLLTEGELKSDRRNLLRALSGPVKR